MKYDLSPLELLKLLGFDQPVGREALKTFQEEAGIPLPKLYRKFLELAMDCPLLGTGDLWCGQMIPIRMRPCLLYAPVEQARQAGLPNYLEIGSDYCTGMLTFGIRLEDLDQEDPQVWQNHDFEPRYTWRLANQCLTDFLMEVLMGALALVNYDTAEEALEARGWTYADYTMEYLEAHAEEEDDDEDGSSVDEQALLAKGIDPEQVRWRECPYGGRLFCCADIEKGVLYAGRWDAGEENTLYTITRTDNA